METEKVEISIPCSCGGGASVKIDPGVKSAVVECACGNTLFWSAESSAPAPLGVNVAEHIKTVEKVGG